MERNIVTVSTKYQVVIPKDIRKVLNVQKQDKLLMTLGKGGEIVIKQAKPISFKSLIGTFKYPKNYLCNERLSWEKSHS